jgi:hypothetical protein
MYIFDRLSEEVRGMKSKGAIAKSNRRRRNRSIGRKLVVESLEDRQMLATLTNAPGDGTLTIVVDGYGSFGADVGFAAGDALFDPVGNVGVLGTTSESGIAIRIGNAGVRQFLTTGMIGPQTVRFPDAQTSGSSSSVTSMFSAFGLNWQLDQTIEPMLNIMDERVGTLLTQTYTIDNPTNQAVDVDIVRYADANLLFNGTTPDGGGRILNSAGDILFTTDSATASSDVADVYGIQATGAQALHYEVSAYNPILDTGALRDIRTLPGGDLLDIISGDNDGDNFIDSGADYDVTMGLQSLITIPAVQDEIYVTRTYFGQLAPQDIQPPTDGSITGIKWHDLNQDGVRQANEPVIPGWQVYVDLDNSGTFESNAEPTALTDNSGTYLLAGLAAGTYTVAEVNQPNWVQTFPAAGTYTVDVTLGQTVTDIDFGNRDQNAIVNGLVYADFNGNGVFDAGETPQEGWTVYDDVNNSGTFDSGEPFDTSGADGNYDLSLGPGNHAIREVVPPNWTATQPAGSVYNVSLVPQQVLTDMDFGNDPDPASISGTKFNDENQNSIHDISEAGLPGFTFYIDENQNGVFDNGEPSAVSRFDGRYIFPDLNPGTVVIREQELPGWDQTFPQTGGHSATLDAGTVVTGKDFGNRAQSGTVFGSKFNDINGNGVRDFGEPGLAGFFIYIDEDRDVTPGLGEPAAITGADGRYEILDVRPGSYFVREVPIPGWAQTFPANGDPQVILVTPGATVGPIVFGNLKSDDFGDAPEPYPTAGDGAASHGALLGLSLGLELDSEVDGQPDANALGDDQSGVDDEDGVTFVTHMAPGEIAEVDVEINNGVNAPGSLQGWIDFNQDGSWDSSEQIISDQLLATGTHRISFQVPASAEFGGTYARFRYAHESGLGPAGHTVTGEVEDYRVLILSHNVQATDDAFTVSLNTGDNIANSLDVLANDAPSIGGTLSLISATTPDQGGSVTIDRNGTFSDSTDDTIAYTPRPNFTGDETFTYTIADTNGRIGTATVVVNVGLPAGVIAVDNSFFVDSDSTANTMDVLGNDIAGLAGPVVVSGFTSPSNGTITFQTGSNTLLAYTPSAGYIGLDSFTYTARDTEGNASTATVTVHVGDDTLDDIAQIDFVVVGGNNVSVGDTITVEVYVSDVRALSNVPGNTPLNQGIFSTYFDFLYTAGILSPVEVRFGSDYPVAQIYRPSVPGLLDESGAFQAALNAPLVSPLGAEQHLLFEVDFVANQIGLAQIVSDPADTLPEHETATNLPAVQVLTEQITFDSQTIIVGPPGAAAGIRLVTTNMADEVVSSVLQGSQFKLKAYVDDLTMPDLTDGVFSFYSDVTYDPSIVSVDPTAAGGNPFNITFGADYGSGQNVTSTAGLLDELGAFQSDSTPLGTDEVLLYEIVFDANVLGSTAFVANPADDSIREVLLVDSLDMPVPTNLVEYGAVTIDVVNTLAPSQNPVDPLDVNGDGSVSPIDVLISINAFGQDPGADLTGPNTTAPWLDVNGDGEHTPQDILQIINYINSVSGIGNGEGEAIIIPAEDSNSTVALAAASSNNEVVEETEAIQPLLETTPATRRDSNDNTLARKSADNSESLEDVIAAIAGDVQQAWIA